MNKLFPIVLALIFFSCDKDSKKIFGCTDSNACNYNSKANIFDNSCYYAKDWEDDCGICDQDTSNDCVQYLDINDLKWSGSVVNQLGRWASDNEVIQITSEPNGVLIKILNIDGSIIQKKATYESWVINDKVEGKKMNYDNDSKYYYSISFNNNMKLYHCNSQGYDCTVYESFMLDPISVKYYNE
tara:strand:- start:155 stop:709 length:555 start_codon:yes stop_codon:yes gene_type:complete